MIVWISRCLLLLAALSAPSVASAGPITVGSWSAAPLAESDSTSFYSGRSWDCYYCGVGYVLESQGSLEYLHDDNAPVAFSFDDPSIPWSLLSSQTAWTGGIFGYNGGAFTYDNRNGGVFSSVTSPWQFALFRLVGTDFTHYFLGIEDISLAAAKNDRDYNDFVVRFSLPNDPPHSVPEPSTALLMGTALAVGAVVRGFKRRRATSKPAPFD